MGLWKRKRFRPGDLVYMQVVVVGGWGPLQALQLLFDLSGRYLKVRDPHLPLPTISLSTRHRYVFAIGANPMTRSRIVVESSWTDSLDA